ncbi:MAG: hypothetical protein A3G20_01410 [Acidobacteria bacterium RIFCSPLOWO2_12_FULL_59_11]|nr:MAG: hypothetical protein A3G20_01410 [Acidobacteria bacterium RIFCSPLOWO2_12_FULL_59_11]OFW17814.1 MAG: hypothetical protein A3H27_15595 [Acidobacteria bacterium RIFCSPLOWO2_02_FULL_59_13]
MAARIVLPALAPSIPTNELAALTTAYLASMGTFFEMVNREVSEAHSTDFDGIEFLVKGAIAETSRFDGAISKMTNQHVGGEGPQGGKKAKPELLNRQRDYGDAPKARAAA